jgi:hypothetical protein
MSQNFCTITQLVVAVLLSAFAVLAAPAADIPMPENAALLLYVPAPRDFENRLYRAAARALPPHYSVEENTGSYWRNLSAAWELPAGTRLASIMAETGLNPEAPVLIAIDLTPLERAMEKAAALAEEGDPWQHRSGPGAESPALARIVISAGCTDADTFMKWAAGITGPAGRETAAAGRDSMLAVGDAAFAVSGSRAYISNDAAWIQETRPVLEDIPAPAEAAGDAVLLTRLDRIWRLPPPLDHLFDYQFRGESAITEQLARIIPGEADLFTSPDPCVTAVRLDETFFDLDARIDLGRHEKYAARIQALPAGHLAAYLPESAVALGVTGFSDPLQAYQLPLFPDLAHLGAPARDIRAAAGCLAPGSEGVPGFAVILETGSPAVMHDFLDREGPLMPADSLPDLPGVTCFRAGEAGVFQPHLAVRDTINVLASSRELMAETARNIFRGNRTRVLEKLPGPVTPEAETVLLVSLEETALQFLISMGGLQETPPGGLVSRAVKSVFLWKRREAETAITTFRVEWKAAVRE